MTSLSKAADEYLEMRRSLGFNLLKAGRQLLKFIAFLEARDASYITTALALEWAQQPASGKPVTWANRLSIARGFAKYQSAIDARTEIPPGKLFLSDQGRRVRPYIYSDKEILALMDAARQLQSASAFTRQTYYCLLGLLSVTGMRIGEALSLKMSDVDLVSGVLTVEAGKNRKTRLVPLHDSATKALSNYVTYRGLFLSKRFRKAAASDYLFLSGRGNRLPYCVFARTFRRLSKVAGLRAPNASLGPRIHDMRHRFAMETMVRWYRNGENVEKRLPVLSTFLGHAAVKCTYWYLAAFPELMGAAVSKLEQRWREQI